MKKLPTFGYVEYYRIEEIVPEGKEPKWITEWSYEFVWDDDGSRGLEGALDDWKNTMAGNMDEPLPEFKFEKKKLSNREFEKKYLIGSPIFGGDNELLDEAVCPREGCGHYQLEYDGGESGHACSNPDCGWMDKRAREVAIENERPIEKGPDYTLLVHGQDPKAWARKYNFVMDKHQGKPCRRCRLPLDWDQCMLLGKERRPAIGAKCVCGANPILMHLGDIF